MATHVFTENCSNYPQDFEIFGDDRNKIKILAANIDGIKTDIVFCDYSENQLLVVSQYQKIGTLVSVTKGVAKNLNKIDDLYDIKIISGLDTEELHLAARYLSQQLNIYKPILFSICLKNSSVKVLKSIVKILKEKGIY